MTTNTSGYAYVFNPGTEIISEGPTPSVKYVKRLCFDLSGPAIDFANDKVGVVVDPDIFGGNKNKIRVYSANLMYCKSNAPFGIEIYAMAANKPLCYMNRGIVMANNAKKAVFWYAPPSCQQDYLCGQGLTLVSCDTIAQDDINVFDMYGPDYHSGNILDSIRSCKADPFWCVPRDNPALIEIMCRHPDLVNMIDQNSNPDGTVRLGEKDVRTGVEMAYQRYRRSPEVDVGAWSFHAVASNVSAYQTAIERLQQKGMGFSVSMVIDITYCFIQSEEPVEMSQPAEPVMVSMAPQPQLQYIHYQ